MIFISSNKTATAIEKKEEEEEIEEGGVKWWTVSVVSYRNFVKNIKTGGKKFLFRRKTGTELRRTTSLGPRYF